MKRLAVLLATFSAISAQAYEARYTKGQIAPDLKVLLKEASTATGTIFKPETFLKVEERPLANNNFTMWVQAARGIPVKGTAVRIWTGKDGSLVQAEVNLSEKTNKDLPAIIGKMNKSNLTDSALVSSKLSALIANLVTEKVGKHATDGRVLSMKSQDVILNGDVVRIVDVRSRRGTHQVTISLTSGKVVSSTYREFQPVDSFSSLEANVYPIYEEVEGAEPPRLLETVKTELKYVSDAAPVAGDDPLAALRARRYFESNYNPIFAVTPRGRASGYWSSETVRAAAEDLIAKLPTTANDFSSGLYLRGKYVNINIHPEAKAAYGSKVQIPLLPTASYMPVWKQTNGRYELVPTNGLTGHKWGSANDIAGLLPVRLPDHDAATYLNAGFDEIQVYYAVTTLMDSLNEMGLTDPEFSTKAFEAYLYDPDIGMRDNAYYTDNTINFTTYSSNAGNAARDNSTIWHELGHGIMDRLMGPFITLADTGGLSEGMADFVAMLVIQHQTNNQPFPGKENFRIINQTSFFMTNEVHDDGEAYGGSMNDILSAAIARDGRSGLYAVADITMEAMRLTRNHPGLTAQDWFNHMLYADELGGPNRAAGAYHDLIVKALGTRNFSFDESATKADLQVEFQGRMLDSSLPASRENPLPACDLSGVAHFDLKVSVKDGDTYSFTYPVKVAVEFKTHALQGAVRWLQEDINPRVYTLNNAADVLALPLDASMTCDSINQPDGTCKDYAYIQVYSAGEERPRGKKRFYLKIKPNPTSCP